MNKIFLIGGATCSFNFGSRLTAIEGIVDGKSSSRVSRPPTPPNQDSTVVGLLARGLCCRSYYFRGDINFRQDDIDIHVLGIMER